MKANTDAVSSAQRSSATTLTNRGHTTAPFDMLVLNGMSRYHLCIEALRRAPRVREAQRLIAECNQLITGAVEYSREHLEDLPEIGDWVWTE